MRSSYIGLPAFLLCAALAVPSGAAAQETAHDGHEAASHEAHATGEEAGEVPLYDDLGDHHYEITTGVRAAQLYFDQGLRLYYAFNHQEAIRSFREAQRLDPECAMCRWGEALAWGPNINLPMDAAAAEAAWTALEETVDLKAGVNARERALIEALATRYAPEPQADRAALDSAYASAMEKLTDRYPRDPEIAVLYAESQMNLRPWDYWTEAGAPHPGIPGALSKLESVMARNPDHPGACHFYIHAVEKLYPERAVACAERLADLMPGAGHLVHMPGHIYIRVGRYMDAIEMNEHAVHADETYIQDQRPGVGMYTAGYYPHNYDFMAFAALMAGRRAQAVEAAEKLATLIPEEMYRLGDMVFGQHYLMRPLQVYVRFGLWDEILDEPAPPEGLPHADAMWRYARGRAAIGAGDLTAAGAELEKLRTAAEGPALADLRLEFNGAQHVLSIAAHVLAGRLAEAQGTLDVAVAELQEAARLEDELLYGEPPEWTVPVRQELGAVLLAAGRPAEAARAFREDLERFPDNGWSLHGLKQALESLGEDARARRVAAELALAWEHADVALDEIRER